MNLTRYEKAAAVAVEIQPDLFLNFFKDGRELVGVVFSKQDEIEHVRFSSQEISLMCRMYDLTLGTGACPYGSKGVDTLIAHRFDHQVN